MAEKLFRIFHKSILMLDFLKPEISIHLNQHLAFLKEHHHAVMTFGYRIKYSERKALFQGYFTFIDLIKETNNPPPKT